MKSEKVQEKVTLVKKKKKNDTFEGWPSMKSIEETSQSMYASFLWNHTTQPFCNLTCLWLNYIFIDTQKANDTIDYLVKGLANAPVF